MGKAGQAHRADRRPADRDGARPGARPRAPARRSPLRARADEPLVACGRHRLAGGLRRRRPAGPRPARMGLRRARGPADRRDPRRLPGLDHLARAVAGRRDDRRGRNPRRPGHRAGPGGRAATSLSLRTDTCCASSPLDGSTCRRRPAGCSPLGRRRCRCSAGSTTRPSSSGGTRRAHLLDDDSAPALSAPLRYGRHAPAIRAPEELKRGRARRCATICEITRRVHHDQPPHGSHRAPARRRWRAG